LPTENDEFGKSAKDGSISCGFTRVTSQIDHEIWLATGWLWHRDLDRGSTISGQQRTARGSHVAISVRKQRFLATNNYGL